MSNRKEQKTEDRRQKSEGVQRRGAFFLLLLSILSSSFAVGCRMDMQDQPRVEAYEKGSIRKPVEGTVARGYLREDKHLYTGKKEKTSATTPAIPPPTIQSVVGQPNAASLPASAMYPDAVDTFPFPITEKIVKRGEDRYNIFCGMCHGPTGHGDGMIIRRGFKRRPPSYHTDQLRQAPVGHFFDVITNGWGAMASYSSMVPVTDRWAIVAYIRALQLSQNPQGTTASNAPAAAPTNQLVRPENGERR